MFGMGFTEILLIAVVAIIALGPDKLPNAMVEIAKFIKKMKSGLDDAKSSLDEELNISEMKEEANKFKAQIENVKATVKEETSVDLSLDDVIDETPKKKIKKEKKVAKKENKEDKRDKEEKKSSKKSDKFKVNLNKEESKKEDN